MLRRLVVVRRPHNTQLSPLLRCNFTGNWPLDIEQHANAIFSTPGAMTAAQGKEEASAGSGGLAGTRINEQLQEAGICENTAGDSTVVLEPLDKTLGLSLHSEEALRRTRDVGRRAALECALHEGVKKRQALVDLHVLGGRVGGQRRQPHGDGLAAR